MERIVVQDCYADVPFGIFVVRGENVMLLGEVDPTKETQLSATLKLVTEPEIRRALVAQKEDNVGTFEWPLVDDF
jgi:U6 snRNA-associated Sm-like protein LSm1